MEGILCYKYKWTERGIGCDKNGSCTAYCAKFHSFTLFDNSQPLTAAEFK